MDPAQILLFIIIIILTIFLVVLGIQVSLILKDLRVTLSKTNKLLDNANAITEDIAEPVSIISKAILSIKSGAALLGLLKKVSGSEKEKK
jgi:hypothetical protein